jgi:hypothetical protein
MPPSGYHHEPVTDNEAVYLGQGGDARGNMVFPRYSDNDDDDPDTEQLEHMHGCERIHDPYDRYGDGVTRSP